VAAETHPYISTGLHQHKFGVPIARARELYRLATSFPYLDPVGVSVHIGSQITDAAPFGETMERVVALVGQLRADGLNISFADAGGGLGIGYREAKPGDFERSLKAYAKALLGPLRSFSRQNLGLHLLLEPGRSIVAASGALLTRALYAKENDGKQFLVTDAAMNDLVRPSLYGAHHEIVPVSPRKAGAAKTTANQSTLPHNTNGAVSGVMDVVGPVCETGDFFARDRHLPPVAAGDLLAILDAGAYGMSLASNYNTRGRAAEVLVEGRKVRLIRRRESFEDLVRAEL
jgi:diaminopimelate decarboxylase